MGCVYKLTELIFFYFRALLDNTTASFIGHNGDTGVQQFLPLEWVANLSQIHPKQNQKVFWIQMWDENKKIFVVQVLVNFHVRIHTQSSQNWVPYLILKLHQMGYPRLARIYRVLNLALFQYCVDRVPYSTWILGNLGYSIYCTLSVKL